MNKIKKIGENLNEQELNELNKKTNEENKRLEQKIDEILSKSLSLMRDSIFKIEDRLNNLILKNDSIEIELIEKSDLKIFNNEIIKLEQLIDSKLFISQQKSKWKPQFNEIEITQINLDSKIKAFCWKEDKFERKQKRLIKNLSTFGKWLDLVLNFNINKFLFIIIT